MTPAGSSSPSAHLCPPSLGPAFSQLLGRCVAGELDVAESLLETMERAMNASGQCGSRLTHSLLYTPLLMYSSAVYILLVIYEI